MEFQVQYDPISSTLWQSDALRYGEFESNVKIASSQSLTGEICRQNTPQKGTMLPKDY